MRSPCALGFNDRDQLKAWLATRLRGVCLGIAMRAALRVLVFAAQAVPLVGEESGRQGIQGFRRSLFLCFRATARIAVICPARADEFGPWARATLGLFSAYPTAIPAPNAFVLANDSAFAAIRSYAMAFSAARLDRDAYSAAFAVASVNEAAASAVSAAAAAAKVACFSDSEIWSSASQDALFIAEGGVDSALASRPLWPLGMPDWATVNWEQLKKALPAKEHWDVWIHWYEDRLVGRVYSEPVELAFLADSLIRSLSHGSNPDVDPVETNNLITEQLESMNVKLLTEGRAAT